MVKMRVRKKNMPNRVNIVERKVADAGSRIDQDIVVDQHR
jgi:hypothetical protein